jgi:hypothetical protein
MKMTDEHCRRIASLVATLDTEDVRSDYRAGRFPRAEAVKDPDKRYRWDLFRAAMRGHGDLMDALYAYLTDVHIDTALRRMVRPL